MDQYTQPSMCERQCSCKKPSHPTKLVVVTGGPGAGKTAVLEMAKKQFCEHVAILPESASIIFKGGFWRLESKMARRAAQRAIFHVQREVESLVTDQQRWAVGLCDRGTLDGLAYWPGEESEFWAQLKTERAREFSKYAAVIHVRTPSEEMGYNFQNELRIETSEEARVIDERIKDIWCQHPKYAQVPSAKNFVEKAQSALQLIQNEIPECCRLESFRTKEQQTYSIDGIELR